MMRHGAAAMLCAVLAPVLLAQQPGRAQAPPRDARNASYWNRIDHPPPDPLQPPRSWYQPVTPMAGAPGPFLPVAAPAQRTIGDRVLDEASQFAQANNSQALIVVHKGVVQLERYYGGADAATEFSSHSFAKTLAALALGAAQADGKVVSLDQPASTWLPEWRDPKRQDITLRQLLTMSGGFRTAPDLDPAGHYMQLHYGADIEAIAASAMPNYPPGQGWAFDNDNLHGIALVVERATGLPYADYVSQRLWQPLGASRAELMLDREGGRAYAYCCMWSLPRDWVRLGQMLLDGGVWQGRRLLPQAFVDALRKPSSANPNFGFQVMVGAAWLDARINRALAAQRPSLSASAAPDLYYLSGAGGLQMAIVPSDDLVILRVGKGAPGWREHLLPNLLHAGLHAEQAVDWGWVYDWRMATRQPMTQPSLYDPFKPNYWPSERVAGRYSAALPRRASPCLTAEALAPALAETQRVKSYSFLVWRDGAVEFEHYGAGFGPDTRAESASMHKSVLGLVVGQAVADGAIPGLQSPVSRWLTEWAGDARGAITVGQMLQMASGLAPLKFDLTPGADYSRSLYGPDAVAVPLKSVLVDAPGSRFNYISGISELLGLIVERATKRRYAEYLSERLWQPLGAADAYVALDRPGGIPRTFAALLARPEDWLRLGLLFIDHGRVGGVQVVDPAWLDAMAAPSPANPNYGLHLWRGSPHAPLRGYNVATPATVPAAVPFLADDMLFFDGAGAQRVYVSPREKLVIVRLGAAAFDWDDSKVANLVTAAARRCASR